MKSFIKRPIQNIRAVDWKAVGFVTFFCGLFVFAVIPNVYKGDFISALRYYFSFSLLEVSNIEEPSINNALSQTYHLANTLKVITWFMILIITLVFLFKTPKSEKEQMNINIE